MKTMKIHTSVYKETHGLMDFFSICIFFLSFSSVLCSRSLDIEKHVSASVLFKILQKYFITRGGHRLIFLI